MLLAERQNQILEQLKIKGKVYATDLAEELQVSEDTIRRDLNKLGEANLIRRVHGGALSLQQNIPDYIDRLNNPDVTKKRFAEAAVLLLQSGQTILIDSGETCRYLAILIPIDMKITVVTGCPLVVCELARHQNIEIILLGGRFFKPALRCIGKGTIDMLRKIRIDVSFFGIYALHTKYGFSVNYIEEAEIGQAVIEQSDKVVLMGAANKLNKASSHQIVPISEIDLLITEKSADASVKKQLAEAGLEIIEV